MFHEWLLSYTNTCSLMSKFLEFVCFVEVHKPHVLFVTETWLKPDVPDTLCDIVGYRLYRSDSSIHPGYDGVCIYLRDDVIGNFSVEPSYINMPGIDSIFLSLRSSTASITVGCVYRPRASNSDHILLHHLSNMATLNDSLLVFGDFNIPQLKWPLVSLPSGNNFTVAFAEMLINSGLSQLITEPTRFRDGQNPSTLDLLLVNDSDMVSNITFSAPLGKSDHVCIMCTLHYLGTSPNSETRKISVVNYRGLNEALLAVDWENILAGNNVDDIWNKFMTTVTDLRSKYSQLKTVRHCRTRPWISDTLLSLIKLKKSLWQRYKRSQDREDFLSHRNVSNHLSSMLRRAKADYEDTLITSDNKKKFYKYVRSKISSKVSVPLLRDDHGNICQNPCDTANTFADHFFKTFCAEPDGTMPDLSTSRCLPGLEGVSFDPRTVESELCLLKMSTSPGLDGLSAALLRQCSSGLCLPISLIMQKSFNLMVLPQAWKNASVTPIFKSGDKLSPDNYRPVSLVPIVAKVAERIIVRSALPFLLNNSVIPDQQHGFVPGRSVITNMLTCLDDWTMSYDMGRPVDVIYFDYSKAFDRVPKRRLLLKLENGGIRGNLLGWIDNFLSLRTFTVKVGNAFSHSMPVLSGVPQGSVLGPLLFLVYVSDLPRFLQSKCCMYADDLKIYANPSCSRQTLHRDIETIAEWSSTWLLPLNTSKCSVLHIGKCNPCVQYYIEGAAIKPVKSQNDLGIIVTSDLVWSEHILSIVSKANRISYLISKTFRGCSPLTAAKLFTTYVRPILEFAGPVWNPDLQRDVNILESVQRRFTRLPYRRNRPEYEDRRRVMKLPSLVERRSRGDLIVTYRALSGRFGVDLSHMFELNLNRLRGHSFKLKKQTFTSTVRRNFLCNRVFSAWNGLPSEVVGAESVNSFKNRLDRL